VRWPQGCSNVAGYDKKHRSCKTCGEPNSIRDHTGGFVCESVGNTI